MNAALVLNRRATLSTLRPFRERNPSVNTTLLVHARLDKSSFQLTYRSWFQLTYRSCDERQFRIAVGSESALSCHHCR
jgi:hypothetical protein